MQRFVQAVATFLLISAGCCTGGNQSVDDENGRSGLFSAREAPRADVGVAIPGVLRSTPTVRSNDSSFSSRNRSAQSPITADVANEGDLDGRVSKVEDHLVKLTDVVKAVKDKIDVLDKKVTEKCP